MAVDIRLPDLSLSEITLGAIYSSVVGSCSGGFGGGGGGGFGGGGGGGFGGGGGGCFGGGGCTSRGEARVEFTHENVFPHNFTTVGGVNSS